MLLFLSSQHIRWVIDPPTLTALFISFPCGDFLPNRRLFACSCVKKLVVVGLTCSLPTFKVGAGNGAQPTISRRRSRVSTLCTLKPSRHWQRSWKPVLIPLVNCVRATQTPT